MNDKRQQTIKTLDQLSVDQFDLYPTDCRARSAAPTKGGIHKKPLARFSRQGANGHKVLVGFDFHDFFRFYELGSFWQRDRQHTFAEMRVDPVGIDPFGQVEDPLE